MKYLPGWLALLTLLYGGTAAHAQGVLVPVSPYGYAPGYASGGGIGFGYQRGGLSIGGFIGSRYSSPVLVGPYGPYYPVYPGYTNARVTVNYYLPGQQRFLPRQPLADELAGVDLDAQPLKKKVPTEEPPLPKPEPKPPELKQPPPPEPEPDFKLPGVDVSKPKEVVRPEDLPKPKIPKKLKVQAPSPEPPVALHHAPIYRFARAGDTPIISERPSAKSCCC